MSQSQSKPLTRDQIVQVNSICNRFERAWHFGKSPSIEAAAAGADSLVRPALLQHLVELDIQCRISRGNTVDLNVYLARWPDLDRNELQMALESASSTGATSVLISDSSASHTPAESARQVCTLDEFLLRLRGSRLLTESDVDSLKSSIATDDSARSLGMKLVDDRKLTSFQVTTLLEETGDPLILGEYVIQDLVGRGGMGTVYRAIHRRMKRAVALKVLRRDIPHADVLAKRFLREVEVAAKLCHPNIVTAYDAGEQNGVSFLVSEFVEGQNLGDLVRQYGPLSLPLAVDVVLQAARALEYAHGEGVIHRDIKPSNLLLDDSGNVKLLDVGLARINAPDLSDPDGSSDLTTTGMIMGTVDYMSPEQAQNTRLADERSDVYSLGCTLYFLLSGRAPYAKGTGIERLLAHREQPIPSIRALSADMPEAIDDLLRLLLAKKSSHRVASMSLVVSKLESLKFAGLPDLTLACLTVDEESEMSIADESLVAATQAVADMSDSQLEEPTVIASQGRGTQETDDQIPVDSVAISAARAREINRVSSVDRRPSKRGSMLPWIVVSGILAVAIAAIFFRPDRSNSGSLDVPESGPPAELLSDKSESDVRRYRDEWALALKEESRVTAGGVGFVLIPPGRFLYGEGSQSLEVAMENQYWLSESEITVGQFREFVEANSNYQTIAEKNGTGWGKQNGIWIQQAGYCWKNLGENFVTDDSPACSIAYSDAIAFCEWMSRTTGRKVRLPTEQEWEYACRCGRLGAWSFGDDVTLLDQYAWTKSNSALEIHTVGELKSNPWGLFDMHGNEYEWCFEPTAIDSGFSGMGPVRGGGFASSPEQCRSSAQHQTLLSEPTQGAFRVLMEPQ